MKEILIKKTKSGAIVTVRDGMLRVDGVIAESLRNIPEGIKEKAQAALPGAAAMSGKILFTDAEVEKIGAALESTRKQIGLSDASLKKLARDKANEDINCLTADIPDDPNFSDATEGQHEIYRD